MNEKVLKDCMFSLEKKMLSDMQDDIYSEIKKGVKKCDIDKVSELTEEAYIIRHGGNGDISAETAVSKKELVNKIINTKKAVHFSIGKWITVSAACIAVMFGLNTASMKVLGQNFPSSVYEITKGGINIYFENQHTIVLPTDSYDKYGMKAKCEEYGFSPETPSYIPEDFALVNFKGDDFQWSSVTFYYKRGNAKLNVKYMYYEGDYSNVKYSIPSSSYEIEEEVINGHIVNVLKEDSQYYACYINQHIMYSIFAENLDYDECYKIVESIS